MTPTDLLYLDWVILAIAVVVTVAITIDIAVIAAVLVYVLDVFRQPSLCRYYTRSAAEVAVAITVAVVVRMGAVVGRVGKRTRQSCHASWDRPRNSNFWCLGPLLPVRILQ